MRKIVWTAAFAALLCGVALGISALAGAAPALPGRAVPAAPSGNHAQPGHHARPTPRFTASKPARPSPARRLHPANVLYDQYNNEATNSTSSQDFESGFDTFDDFLGDDFNVNGGDTWTVNTVDAEGVYFNGTGPAV